MKIQSIDGRVHVLASLSSLESSKGGLYGGGLSALGQTDCLMHTEQAGTCMFLFEAVLSGTILLRGWK